MSLNYLYEILIHYHTYKNIDLINQGIYQIKTKISSTFTPPGVNVPQKYYAVPYYFTESKDLENMYHVDEKEIKPHCVINNSIGENNYEYVTKSFIIRYADEEVELDEFCYFRLEIPSTENPNKITFDIEFELNFSDALSSVGKDVKNGNFPIQNLHFKTIQTQHVLIYNESSNKIYFTEMYSPIVYHDSFSSLLNVSIHKSLIDFKIRYDPHLMPFALEKGKEENDTSNNTGNANKINKQKQNNSALTSNNNASNSNNKNGKELSSLINFILDSKDIKPIIPENVIDDLYSQYVIVLINTYFHIKKKLTKLSTKLIEDNMKADLELFLKHPPLIIYTEEGEETIELNSIDEMNNKIKCVSKRIKEYSKDYIGFRIFQEINFISSQISYIWHKYIELIRYFPGSTNFIMMMEFKSKLKEDLFKFLKKAIISISETSSLLIPIEVKLQEHNNTQANEIRNSLINNYVKPSIENENYKVNPSMFPILFEETYMKNLNQNSDKQVIIDSNVLFSNINTKLKQSSNIPPLVDINTNNITLTNQSNINNNNTNEFKYDNSLGLHLIVLVHGFQGNSNDMRLIKNEIALINPSCVFLSSMANQEDTEIDFVEMGKKLADEVKNYIKEWTEGLIFKKLSFIGHSIGGVIIRAALPHLAEFKNKFWMFISLSSPHLGYAFSESKIINAGMWVLKKWKGSKSLEQLMLSDKTNMKETCVYKISEYEGLNWFNYVYLLSSHQDYYAPYESTRIQLSDKTLEQDTKAETYRAMAYNILSKLTNNTLKRVDVNFVIQEKNLDSFIGRTAHIQFLENTDFMKIFFHNIEDQLK